MDVGNGARARGNEFGIPLDPGLLSMRLGRRGLPRYDPMEQRGSGVAAGGDLWSARLLQQLRLRLQPHLERSVVVRVLPQQHSSRRRQPARNISSLDVAI